MSEVFEQTKRKLHNHLLPCTPFAILPDITTAPLAQVAVQVNVFDCGGVAISICMLHQLADASVLSSFLKCWASIARSAYEEVANVPDINVASFLFPIPIGFMPGGGQLYNPWIGQEKQVGIRFVFDGKAITALKEKAKSEGVPNPTRIEAISGFIWKCAMSAFTATSGSLKPSILLHAVNIRGRMEPPLPSYAFGNLFRLAVSLYGFDNKSVDLELPSLVGLISHAIKQLNSDSLKKIQGDEGYVEITRNMNLLKEVIHKQNPLIFIFTSWCHMGFNEIDFGWGKPFWVGISGEETDQAYANHVVLKETKCGDGIEAWINLNEQEMAVLKNDLEFLAFASSDPHIF